ncbi:MAG TPA: phosphoribosylanthranilate isomerase [Tepidisphaeraceae bacterium]|nr:phosphoribosylanthranilate isomerase [Tepidisphaeraceae bacterium]
MHRTRVKICGITAPQDAAAAAAAGADAIGMVFYAPAPRHITCERAKEILGILPPFVSPVGLFVDAPAEEIRRVAGELHLRHVQLHGHEPPQHLVELRGLQVIKALRVDACFAETLPTWRRATAELSLTNLRGIVVETGGTREAGGTGVPNDWAAVQHQREAGAFEGLPQLIAAGGLTPESVGDVVRKLRPWAVDVSSGVESTSRGIKSVERIHAFVRAVREADAQINRQGSTNC